MAKRRGLMPLCKTVALCGFAERHEKGGERMKYHVEVLAFGEKKWSKNGLTFDTPEAAEEYGKDLFARWTALDSYRVVDENGKEY